MRIRVVVLIALLVLSACGGESGPAAKREAGASDPAVAATQGAGKKAVAAHDLDLAACLSEQEPAAEEALGACPTYVLQSLDYMQQECSTVGGQLQANPVSELWKLDVDADGSSEVVIDLNENFTCYGAPSVFGCGSLGCPYFLYDQRADSSWFELGAINADDAPGIEVLPGEPGKFATLRGGCVGERPCSEFTYYTWNGKAYDRSWIEIRGHIVDVVPGHLWTLAKDSGVLVAPEMGSQVLDDYPAGTAMLVIGTAREGPYKYVSPCNACRRGFVETALLKKES